MTQKEILHLDIGWKVEFPFAFSILRNPCFGIDTFQIEVKEF